MNQKCIKHKWKKYPGFTKICTECHCIIDGMMMKIIYTVPDDFNLTCDECKKPFVSEIPKQMSSQQVCSEKCSKISMSKFTERLTNRLNQVLS